MTQEQDENQISDAEVNLWVQQQIEQQLFDQQAYKEWLEEQKQNEEDHEWETVDRLDKDTVLQVCLVCDADRAVERVKN